MSAPYDYNNVLALPVFDDKRNPSHTFGLSDISRHGKRPCIISAQLWHRIDEQHTRHPYWQYIPGYQSAGAVHVYRSTTVNSNGTHTLYASLCHHSNASSASFFISGGKASGYGYDPLSAAIADAYRRAGIVFETPFSGVGMDSAYVAIKSVCYALQYPEDSIFITVERFF